MPNPTERLSTAVADRYRIERHLGEGGMATVYLAHDLKHDRKVALKVLRPELAAVIGAERFLAEIKTTANLQHPNILPLFDSGEADGQLFYVMPYVEGESLRDRIEREKQLPVDDVVRLGSEVAGALDYAHRQGVIHRDIKPENILIHDGRALVADFGIALAVSTAGSRMTETGMSVGTPHYMSPEQAMGGHEVTARSDVYALGATLYEALVGEPPFTGATAQAIIARIVTEDPRPLRTQRKTIPPHVEGAVLTALERLPADRFATAAELGEALDGRRKVVVRRNGADAMVAAPERSDAKRYRRPVVALGMATLILVGTTLWGWLRPLPPPPVIRQEVVLGAIKGFPAAIAYTVAIAPDGSAIVYGDTTRGGRFGLWLKERGQLRPRELATPRNAPGPSFSPDGRSIAVADGKLERLSRRGGAAVVLSDSSVAWGTAWLDNGTIVSIGESQRHLYSTPASGGPTKLILTADSATTSYQHVSPVPDADAVLVAVGGSTPRIIALNLANDQVHEVQRDALNAWVVGGTLLYVQEDRTLDAVPFDVRRLTESGAPMNVVDSIRTTSVYSYSGAVADAAVGADGTLIYVRGGEGGAAASRLAWVARDGSVTLRDTSLALHPAPDGGLDLSPDGNRVAVSLTGSAARRRDVYVIDLRAETQRRLTFGGTSNLQPQWSTDGRRIMYTSNAGGGKAMKLWAKRADGSGHARLLASDPHWAWGGLWSPDRKWILYVTALGLAGHGDIIGVHVGVDTAHVPLVATPATEGEPALSPGGRWLAYVSDASGRPEVYVRPFPNTSAGSGWQVSRDGGFFPEWAHDGKTLFYMATGLSARMIAASVTTSPTFKVGAQTALFSVRPYIRSGYQHTYAVGPHDRHFLMLTNGALRSDPHARIIEARNWLPEVRAELKGQSR